MSLLTESLYRPIPSSESILTLVLKEVAATLNTRGHFATCCKPCYAFVLPVLCRKCSPGAEILCVSGRVRGNVGSARTNALSGLGRVLSVAKCS